MGNDKYLRAISVLIISSDLLKENSSKSADSSLKRVIGLSLVFFDHLEDSGDGVLLEISIFIVKLLIFVADEIFHPVFA